MKEKKIPVISIIFYVLAALLLAYAIWAGVYSAGIVSEAVEFGQLVVQGNEFEVISFYMGNIALYVLFAIVFFGLGWILQIITPQVTVEFELDDEDTLFEEDLPIEEVEEISEI